MEAVAVTDIDNLIGLPFERRKKRSSLPESMKFANTWDDKTALNYLREFYGDKEVHIDEQYTIADEVARLRELSKKLPLSQGNIVAAEVGCGPTLHHTIPLLGIPQITEVHMYDYLERNLRQVEKWWRRDPSAHDWNVHTAFTLECELGRKPTSEEIVERENKVRGAIKHLERVDLGDITTIEAMPQKYDLVVSPYCADSATSNQDTWRMFMHNLAQTVSPEGVLYLASLEKCKGYLVGGKMLPGANVTEEMLRKQLELDFYPESIHIRRIGLPENSEHIAQGYEGILLADAVRKAA